ncbi:hypothetical protein C8R45DRAFT_1095338 [Mycena sanguinolenta]|nr:hypothetical protein C8R45DRAFT_1095338 [Mycena sanguinolenta]
MSSPPEPTPPPPGFRIIPCTGLDLSQRLYDATVGLTISARLDPNKLEATLSELVRHKFPRAGARVACRNGVYELQIPEKFGSETPPFVFTVQEYPEMYQGNGRPEIPKAFTGSKPCITPDPKLGRFFQSETCPQSLADFVQRNAPLLNIHVTIFKDLTFLGFISSHIAFDAIGVATLLDAWTRLLRGDDIDTIQGMEWDAQPLAPFSCGPVRSDLPCGFFEPGSPLGSPEIQEAMAGESMAGESDPKAISRFFCVPKAFLNEAKQKITDELKAQGSAEYVGSGDVLTAWWLKTVYGDRSPTDQTPIHLHVFKDLRDMPIFANDAPLTDPYIHNLILTIPFPPIHAGALQAESLGALALRIRRSIITYKTDLEGIRDELRWRCAKSNGLKKLYRCPPGAELALQTGARSMNFGGLDFSGASVSNEPRTAARVVFVYPFMHTDPPFSFRGVLRVLMEDADAVWMCDTRGEKHWERIRQAGEIEFADSPPM